MSDYRVPRFRPTDSPLTRVTRVRSDKSATPAPRIHHTHPWIYDDCFGAARRGSEDVCGRCSSLRVGQGSPCHDFGGALRVTDGQSREGRGRSAAPPASRAPTVTARRHARQSRRLRDRAPPGNRGGTGAGSGPSSWPAARRLRRSSVGGAGDCGGLGSGSTSGSGEASSSTSARYA
jgi:hypothetical protein